MESQCGPSHAEETREILFRKRASGRERDNGVDGPMLASESVAWVSNQFSKGLILTYGSLILCRFYL